MHILFIEDDPVLRSNVKLWFQLNQHSVSVAEEGQKGLELANSEEFDCIVLDLMLPKISGWQVLHELENKLTTPILVLSAIDDVQSKVRALEEGAEDYLTKPFEMEELLARAKVLSRTRNSQREDVQIGDIKVNLKKRCAFRNDEKITFTPTEFAIIERLLLEQSQPVSRFRIVESINRADVIARVSDNALDVHISAIRKKTNRDFIKTVRGTGYLIP